MIATTKQECFNIMCQMDVPANQYDSYYTIRDKEGRDLIQDRNLKTILDQYVQWSEESAACDGEYYAWSEDIDVICIDENDQETSKTYTVHMDSRSDGYDGGRAYYESTRL